jgi:hypothetical protein
MDTLSLVSDVFLSKREALSALSSVLRLPILEQDSADPYLVMELGVELRIEVPKYGEDLPLTLDLHGAQHAQLQDVARSLTETVAATLGWSLSVIGEAD